MNTVKDVKAYNRPRDISQGKALQENFLNVFISLSKLLLKSKSFMVSIGKKFVPGNHESILFL